MIKLSFLDISSIGVLLCAAIIFFGLGLLYKTAVVTKQRKRILRLEDEMLANHATILQLEKKIVDQTKDKSTQNGYDMTSRKSSDRGLKAS